jgi:hypothetical protein
VSDWNVVKAADSLRQGDRVIFGEEIGGEGEVVTVESISNHFGTTEIQTEELDFTIDVIGSQPMRMAPPEEEDASDHNNQA